MTEKLYETDGSLHIFTARVLSCAQTENGYAVTLDRTAFFPEGGGQAADTGVLGGVCVRDVRLVKGEILHLTAEPLAVGATVSGNIDYATRHRRMQNHTGEHIVSGLIHAKFGFDNIGFHMGHAAVSLDVNGVLSAQQIKEVERAANRVVYENRPVTVSFPSQAELATLDYRSKLDLTENVRLVTVEGIDCCACCAPHVASTGEIGLIKILRAMPNKGGTRLEILCGEDALLDYDRKCELLSTLTGLFSAPAEKLVSAAEDSLQALLTARGELRRLRAELLQSRLHFAFRDGVFYATVQDASFEEMRDCLAKLTAKGDETYCILSQTPNGTLYAIAGKEPLVSETCRALNAAYGGKGGGKNGFAQGRLSGGA